MKYIIFKIFLITFILYHSELHSKTTANKDFNHRYLSNYFSALVSFDNNNNKEALKYFNFSKNLLNKHEKFLEEYVFSLVEDDQISKAIKQIKYSKNNNNSDFFEASLLMSVDSIKKKNYLDALKYISEMERFQNNGTYEYIIYETLKSYLNLFNDKILNEKAEKFGKLSLITSAFQNCYLNNEKANAQFENLINVPGGEYSRYLFFYITKTIENKNYSKAKYLISEIDPLSSSLIISQAKNWIDKSNYDVFNNFFSCKSENDILAEFFFLIGSLYSSQEEYAKSNFYINISNYLNPKFYFNLSLLAENYFLNNNYNLAKKVLNKFSFNNEIYGWYKTKRIGQIIKESKNTEEFIKYMENKFNKIENPSVKILFDMATIYKNNKKYEKAIEYYDEVLKKIDVNSEAYADTLYRRGGSYERIGNYKMADYDLLRSLDIVPEDPYVLNYLAYSWLERNYKIDEAINMLKIAYKQKKNDPYIIDSIGWAYFLIGDYLEAENYLIQAVQLMPNDPIVNDHYGDILWKLDRKLQAKYFWENVLQLETTEEEMKKNILKKLISGPDKI